jgi:hypothetical protein
MHLSCFKSSSNAPQCSQQQDRRSECLLVKMKTFFNEEQQIFFDSLRNNKICTFCFRFQRNYSSKLLGNNRKRKEKFYVVLVHECTFMKLALIESFFSLEVPNKINNRLRMVTTLKRSATSESLIVQN